MSYTVGNILFKNIFVFTLFLLLLIGGCSKAKTKVRFSEDKILHEAPYLFEAPTYDPIYDLLYFTGYRWKREHLYLFVNGRMNLVRGSYGVGGTYIYEEKYLYAADGAGHKLLRFTRSKDGLVNKEVLFSSDKLHQPNDLCVSSKGVIYFTDPDFKHQKTGGVYVWSKSDGAKKLCSHLPCPNGIILTLDEKKIIVSDSYLKEWRIFDIDSNGDLTNEKLFFKPSTKNKNAPDGMSRDKKGNLYLTGYGGVWVVSELGKTLGFKPFPEFCYNVFVIETPLNKSMIVTSRNKVYQIEIFE